MEHNRHKSSLSLILKLRSVEEKLSHTSTFYIAEALRINYLQHRNFQLQVFARVTVHSSQKLKAGLHFILSLHYNSNLFTYKTRQEKVLTLIQQWAPSPCNKNALRQAAAFTSGAHTKFSVPVSNKQ